MLAAEAFGGCECAILLGSTLGEPALVALNGAGDGGLVDIELLRDPGLCVAVELDPVEDETVAVGGEGGGGGRMRAEG